MTRASPWRWVGAVGGAVSCAGFALLPLLVPARDIGWSAASMLAFALLAVLGALAVWASLAGRGGWLLLVFALSFFPAGLYLLGVPHPARWIGVAIGAYGIAAVGLLVARRQSEK